MREGPSDFHRALILVELLSEDGPVPRNYRLKDIVQEGEDGKYFLSWSVMSEESITPIKMAQLLLAHGRDPEFFDLPVPTPVEELADLLHETHETHEQEPT